LKSTVAVEIAVEILSTAFQPLQPQISTVRFFLTVARINSRKSSPDLCQYYYRIVFLHFLERKTLLIDSGK